MGVAQGGRSVVTTIHQPSSRLYQQLDKLLLLSQARAPLLRAHPLLRSSICGVCGCLMPPTCYLQTGYPWLAT